MIKHIIISLAIGMLTILGNMGCLFTTGYQNARMLDRGEVQVIPEIGSAIEFNGLREEFYIAAGGQLMYGFNERFNLGIRAAYHSLLSDSRLNGVFLGLIPKIGLKEDKLALAFPTYFYNTYKFPGAQFNIHLIRSIFFPNNMDLTITPQVSVTVSTNEYHGIIIFPTIGTTLGCGIPLGKLPITLRPEVGIITHVIDIPTPIFSYGIGFDIRRVKRQNIYH